jgi:hypothetical protein
MRCLQKMVAGSGVVRRRCVREGWRKRCERWKCEMAVCDQFATVGVAALSSGTSGVEPSVSTVSAAAVDFEGVVTSSNDLYGEGHSLWMRA